MNSERRLIIIRVNMSLVWKLRLQLIIIDFWNIIKTIILLITPIVLAISSVWLNLLIKVLPDPYDKWVITNSGNLVAMFGVLAGAYLTLYATYMIKRREERQKCIAIKELAFYTPMLDEIVSAIAYKKKKQYWEFDFQGGEHLWGAKWTFWEVTQTSLLKYNVPKVFVNSLNLLHLKIGEYVSMRDKADSFGRKMAIKMTNDAGLIDPHFKGSYLNVIEDIYCHKFSENNIKEAVPNCKEINIDCILLAESIKREIETSQEYQCFVITSNELDKIFTDVYIGLDYILMRIHKKYKGMNTLL